MPQAQPSCRPASHPVQCRMMSGPPCLWSACDLEECAPLTGPHLPLQGAAWCPASSIMEERYRRHAPAVMACRVRRLPPGRLYVGNCEEAMQWARQHCGYIINASDPRSAFCVRFGMNVNFGTPLEGLTGCLDPHDMQDYSHIVEKYFQRIPRVQLSEPSGGAAGMATASSCPSGPSGGAIGMRTAWHLTGGGWKRFHQPMWDYDVGTGHRHPEHRRLQGQHGSQDGCAGDVAEETLLT